MWNALTGTLVSFAVSVVELFPESPFIILNEMSNSEFYTWLKYLNWFIPVSSFVSILETWLLGIGIYYIYQIVLRWIKVIE